MWIQKVPGGGVMSVAYAPSDGTLYTYDRSGCVTVWDTVARSGRRWAITHRDQFWNVPTLCPLPDGKRILAVSANIALWDADTGAELAKSEQPEMLLNRGRRLFPNGSTYAVHREERVIAGWNILTNSPEPQLASNKLNSRICYFDLTLDGKWAALSFGQEVTVLFERGEGGELPLQRGFADVP